MTSVHDGNSKIAVGFGARGRVNRGATRGDLDAPVELVRVSPQAAGVEISVDDRELTIRTTGWLDGAACAAEVAIQH